MERKQFTFYESFATAIKRIRKASDRCAAYDALVNYALYETLPDYDKLPDAAALFFDLAKPTLDTSRRKAENGKKGGESGANVKREEEESKPEANRKQTGSEKEDENEKEKEGEIEKENECYKGPLTPKRREEMIEEMLAFHGSELLDAVRDWVKYKIEKRQGYKETGFKSLLTQIERSASEYGDQAMVEVIRQSMSSNYQGIMFDRLKGRPAQRGYGSVEAWLNGST